MIGHASLFIETQDCRILIDPVLWDPHQEGLFDVCPKREVIHELLPEFDLLIISHQHLDHFDIRSLAYLPKTVDVFIPRDKLIENYLRKLGYSRIHYLKDFAEVKIGSTSLLATRSEYRVPEHGIVLADQSGVCWNHVDTVVSPNTINFVLSRYSSIDFLLARWQPNLEVNYQTNQSLSFPYSGYSKLLGNISLIQPKALAPAANGFKYLNESSWLNQIVFPVTREQFCQDAKLACPKLEENIFPLDPGDILIFDQGEFHHLAGKCEYVQTILDDRESLDFSPVNVGCNLKDSNPDHYDLEVMKEVIKEEICINLPRFMNENRERLFREHGRWQVIYQLEVVFPNSSQKWYFDFAEDNIKAVDGRNPLANFFTYITASSFYSLLQQTKGWDYVYLGGYTRSFQKIYAVTPLGVVRPEAIKIEEPIQLKIPGNQSLERILEREIAIWGQSPVDSSKSNPRNFSKSKLTIEDNLPNWSSLF